VKGRGVIAGTVAAIAIIAVIGVIASRPSAGTRPPGRAALTIRYTTEPGFSGLTYRLTCDPASGTIPDPAAVCAEISEHPGMVFSRSGRDHSCPGNFWVFVRGTDAGRRVAVAFSACLGGGGEPGVEQAGIERWARFLPTSREEMRIRPDRGLGILSLGEGVSMVRSLLGQPQTTSDGLQIYEPYGRVSSECDPGAGSPYTEREEILAIRYDHSGHVITLVSDNSELTIDGRETPSLIQNCVRLGLIHRDGPRELSKGPLRKWTRVPCDGVSSLADHRLGGESTAILPFGDHPIVVITDDPDSACRDAAIIRSQWRVEGGAGRVAETG
jgi:hypothetical protein